MRLLVLLLCAAAAVAAPTMEWSQGFEAGAFVSSPARSSETGIISSCSGATAAVTAAAARTGAFGAALTVKAKCAANWRLKLQTRDTPLLATKTYSLCMWVRSNYTAEPFTPRIALSFYRYDGGGASTLIDAAHPRITASWARYCYHVPPGLATAGAYFWNLNVGNAVANTVFHFDDITLESEPSAPFDGWMASAPARIEQLRKGDFTLDLRYSDGTPVPAAAVASVSAVMRKHDFVFGLAYSPENFKSTDPMLAWYNAKAGSLFNGLVPENAFKWPYYEPRKGSYATGKMLLDQFYAFAAANDFAFVRQHTVEWFLADPEFTRHWSRNCSVYANNLKARIERDLALFPPVVKSVDVFNELLLRRAWAETCNLFSGGPDSIIVQAFKWAAAARPDLQLCVNDYDLVSTDQWSNMVELVEWLRANGARVDCLGLQSHLGPEDIIPDRMAYRIHKLSSLLNVAVTVSEISFWTAEDTTTWALSMTDEAKQAQAFEAMLTTYFSSPEVSALLLWGFTDANFYFANGGIFRADGTPKPAGVVVENLITSTWNTSSPALAIAPAAPGSNQQAFRGFYGRYEVSVALLGGGGTASPRRISFPASAGAAQTAVVTLDVAPPSGRRLLRARRA